MTDLKKKLDALSEVATPGKWEAALERGCHGVIGTSLPEGGMNFVALVGNDEGSPEKEPTRFANAEIIATLINAYRSGDLIIKGEDTFTREQFDDSLDDLIYDTQMSCQCTATDKDATTDQDVEARKQSILDQIDQAVREAVEAEREVCATMMDIASKRSSKIGGEEKDKLTRRDWQTSELVHANAADAIRARTEGESQ